MNSKRTEEENTRTTGSTIGGAILGASLGGPPGAIIGGIVGAFLGEYVNDSQKKTINNTLVDEKKTPEDGEQKSG